MNVCGVTFGGYLAKILSFKLGNLLYKSNFYLLSEDTVICLFLVQFSILFHMVGLILSSMTDLSNTTFFTHINS